MKKIIKSRPFPIILMAMSLMSILLFNGYDTNWVFINNTLGFPWFTTLLLSLMVLTLFSLTVLSALRVYKEYTKDRRGGRD